MVCLMEDTGDALHLYLNMVNKTLPHRLIADSSIARDSTTTAITDKDYLAIFLQIQCHRSILAPDDVHPIRFVAAILSIIGKDHGDVTGETPFGWDFSTLLQVFALDF